VLLLILVTYSLAVTFDESWAPLIVVLVQIVTVWFALRTSGAGRWVRISASMILAASAVVAAVELLTGATDEPSPAIFAASSLLCPEARSAQEPGAGH
jgi:hypothetical protein